MPELEIVRNELEKASTDLQDSLRGLEGRLEQVLLPPLPSKIVTNPGGSIHSNAVAQLRMTLERIQQCLALVNEIKDRLEV